VDPHRCGSCIMGQQMGGLSRCFLPRKKNKHLCFIQPLVVSLMAVTLIGRADLAAGAGGDGRIWSVTLKK
jgi:hypothetical protein